MPGPNVIELAAALHKAIANHDKIALGRLIKAYGGIWARLQDKADLLALEIAAMDGPVTPAAVGRMLRYKELLAQTEKELTRFSGFMQTELITGTQGSIALGTQHAAALARAAGITGGFNRLPTAAIETLLGFLQDGSPLFARIEALAPFTAKRVADALIEGIGLGMSPRTTASLIRRELGMGLTDALRMTRTAQLYSYREASRANYIANSDVVTGWIWWADLGGDPCMACIAEHGGEHGLDETLDDHHNGRCAMLPKLAGEPVGGEGGEAWFSGLDEAKQRELMGDGRWDAWKGGKFDFADLSAVHDDDVYGQMRTEATLEALLGG